MKSSSVDSESQFNRLRRNCYSDSDFIEKSKTMKNRFLDQGYPSEWVAEALNSSFQKITFYSSKSYLTQSIKKNKKNTVICGLLILN